MHLTEERHLSAEDKPTFSVIIPVYNRADLLVEAVRSVLAQSLQDFEIVIVDDGSSDDVQEALRDLPERPIRFYRQENSGPGAARNNGIDRARGRYVAFLDSDDLYLPSHLETLRKILDGAPTCAVYSPVIVQRGQGRSFVKPPRAIGPDENMALYLVCEGGFVQTSGLALRREIAARVRYRPDARFGDDTDFAIRLQLAGCRFIMTDAPTVVWADDAAHSRLSTNRAIGELTWLEDLRGVIPYRAYCGYRGWHVAKSVFPHMKIGALRLFLEALLGGSYRPRRAVIVFLQIVLPDWSYRAIADTWIEVIERKMKRAT